MREKLLCIRMGKGGNGKNSWRLCIIAVGQGIVYEACMHFMASERLRVCSQGSVPTKGLNNHVPDADALLLFAIVTLEACHRVVLAIAFFHF
jgi:hypothetical protein